MNFDSAPEFNKDVKRLAKKWRSIPDDIEAAKRYILPLYVQLAPDVDTKEYRREFFAGKNAVIIYDGKTVEIIKIRLDVAYLGRNDKVRIVFVAVKTNDEIVFVELFAKNDKNREDKSRFRQYLK